MDKIKILKTGSKEYSTRRVDYFLIKKIPTLHENICAFISALNINIDEFDIDYSGFEGILVSGNKKDRIIITDATDNFIWLMIDTKNTRAKVMDLAEKYFFF